MHLVIGGARSGKSRLAERIAAEYPPVVYVATAEPRDEEMTDRIGRHRERRPADWRTIEVPRDLAAAIASHGTTAGTMLIECVTLWVSNVLLESPRPSATEILQQVNAAIDAARRATADFVWVTNEVGSGIVPENALAREFRDVLGEANERLAAAADHVLLCVAGIALKLK